MRVRVLQHRKLPQREEHCWMGDLSGHLLDQRAHSPCAPNANDREGFAAGCDASDPDLCAFDVNAPCDPRVLIPIGVEKPVLSPFPVTVTRSKVGFVSKHH